MSFTLMGSGDHHWDEHSRFAECIRVHRWIAAEVAQRRPNVFVSAGDIYERASTPVERAAVAEWATEVTETCPLLIAKGNHDRRHDLEFLARLRTKHPIIVEERRGVHIVGGAAIALVAWPSKASLAEIVGEATSGADLDALAQEHMRHVLRDIGAELAEHDGPRILVMHAMVDGSITSVGQPLIGAELNVGLADLGLAGADIAVLGHIHKPQEWVFGEAPYLYTGSPFRTAFGEVEEKSIVTATFERYEGELSEPDARRWGLTDWGRVATPATPMLLVESEWRDGKLVCTNGPKTAAPDPMDRVGGAEVRFRYTVVSDKEQRDAAKAAAAWIRDIYLHAGAASVKLEEEVIATTSARTPEIAAAKTIPDKLDALWRSRSVDINAARRTRLFSRVAELEGALP